MNALILAAGYATRLYPLTKEQPKGLLPLGPATILDCILEQLEQVEDLEQIYLVSNSRFSPAYEAWAREREAQGGRPIQVLDDACQTEEEKLGALGDLDYCLQTHPELAQEELLVLASDNLFAFSLAQLARRYHQLRAESQAELLLVGSALPPGEDIRRFAVAQLDARGRVLHLEEKPQQPQGETIVYALYFYSPRALALLPEYLAEGGATDAPGSFPSWLYSRLPVYLERTEADCLDIGTPESYRAIQQRVAVEPGILAAFAGRSREG